MKKIKVEMLNLSVSQLHEDEAALKISAAVSGPGLRWTEPSGSKSSMLSLTDGLLKIDVRALLKINGSPVLPGAMFLYALLDGTPVSGVPLREIK